MMNLILAWSLIGHRSRSSQIQMANQQGAGLPSDVPPLLNARRLPGILYSNQAGILLGLHDHDITILVAAKILQPLGKPARNAPKRFAAVAITALAQSPDRLHTAIRVLSKHWRDKNESSAHRHKGAKQTLRDKNDPLKPTA